jgi:hypothetical protein
MSASSASTKPDLVLQETWEASSQSAQDGDHHLALDSFQQDSFQQDSFQQDSQSDPPRQQMSLNRDGDSAVLSSNDRPLQHRNLSLTNFSDMTTPDLIHSTPQLARGERVNPFSPHLSSSLSADSTWSETDAASPASHVGYHFNSNNFLAYSAAMSDYSTQTLYQQHHSSEKSGEFHLPHRHSYPNVMYDPSNEQGLQARYQPPIHRHSLPTSEPVDDNMTWHRQIQNPYSLGYRTTPIFHPHPPLVLSPNEMPRIVGHRVHEVLDMMQQQQQQTSGQVAVPATSPPHSAYSVSTYQEPLDAGVIHDYQPQACSLSSTQQIMFVDDKFVDSFGQPMPGQLFGV